MKRKSKKNNKGRSRVDFTKRLAGYSLTAGVVLASGGKAQGAITYSGPMNHPFGSDYGSYDLTMEGFSPEARFRGAFNAGTSMYSTNAARFDVKKLNNNFRVNAGGTMYYSIYNLPFSNRVGPNNNTPSASNGVFYSVSAGTMGPVHYGFWTHDGQSGYFGFSFDLENATSDTVYGWGQVERIDACNGSLLGWAYEDSGADIHVGDTGAPVIPVPSALGLAALGAAGVLSIRRRKKA